MRRLKLDRVVRKVTSKQDRRIPSVTISVKGRELWVAMHADYDRIIGKILSGQSDAQVQVRVIDFTASKDSSLRARLVVLGTLIDPGLYDPNFIVRQW